MSIEQKSQQSSRIFYRAKIRDMTLISLFIVLAVIGGRISVPFFSIPFTLQVLVCLLTGALLGARRALAAQSIYLFMGLMGLPVFALGGGIGYILQPSFGYLPGMLLASVLVGFLSDRIQKKADRRKIPVYLLINLVGLAVIYTVGVLYLYLIRSFYIGDSITFIRAIQLGMLPYLITDGFYCLLAAFLAPGLSKIVRK